MRFGNAKVAAQAVFRSAYGKWNESGKYIEKGK